jgi:hypothetical protein
MSTSTSKRVRRATARFQGGADQPDTAMPQAQPPNGAAVAASLRREPPREPKEARQQAAPAADDSTDYTAYRQDGAFERRVPADFKHSAGWVPPTREDLARQLLTFNAEKYAPLQTRWQEY